MLVWRAKNSDITDYIRAASIDDAQKEFLKRHKDKAVEFQGVDHKVFKVILSDSPSPIFFKGTRQEALAGARLYIKQWKLDATISSVQEI